MPDISLRMLGDAGSAVNAFGSLGTAVGGAMSKIVEFSGESIKKFAEAEKAYRQLHAAAGQYTEALSEQAEAMKRKFAVDDDAIRHMETLLLRYGAAPSQIQATTEAVLNYSAATGKDATGAMEMLIRGVEQGHGSLGRMGVHFQTTGSFAKDLAKATDALGQKFAGAGEAYASSLDGRMHRAGQASDDFKKAVGAMFDVVDQRFGVLDKMAEGFDRLADGARLASSVMSAILDKPGANPLVAAAGAVQEFTFKEAFGSKAGPLSNTPIGGDHAVGSGDGGSSGHYKSELQLQARYEHESLLSLMHHGEEMAKERLSQMNNSLREQSRILKEDREMQEKNQRAFEESQEKNQEIIRRFDEERDRERMRDMERAERELQQRVNMWFRAGEQIANAVVQGVMSYMSAANEAQKARAGFDIFKSVSNVVMSILGTITGQSWIGPAWNGMLGGGQAIFEGATGAPMHTGGWIPRFHGGGGFPLGSDERLSILQTGERVLSRAEVSRMGGMSGVDGAARGGGAPGRALVVQAFDSESLVNFFGRRGAKGMMDSIRLNSGPLRLMFGKG